MKLSRLDIYNFRKLKESKIDVADKKTIFVGANNSGKTSAMNCLILFLKRKSDFTTQDFTLCNWIDINKIGNKWLYDSIDKKLSEDEVSVELWKPLLPQLDVWIDVSEKELQYISKIIPRLDWNGGILGVRLRFEPKKIYALYLDFIENREKVLKLKEKKDRDLKLWPDSLWDFLQRKLHSYFTVNAYIINPDLYSNEEKANEITEITLLDFDPFQGLLKIDIIDAQRGFTDPNSPDTGYSDLSSQLRD